MGHQKIEKGLEKENVTRIFCKLKIIHTKKINFSDLNESHAEQENMTLNELRNTICKIYPGNDELFVK